MASSDKKTLIVLVGPTGVGKTDIALDIAGHFRTPVINADSRQLFAELPIGTAAPTKEQQQRARHYFVGTLHLTDYYNAAMYEHDVTTLADELFKERDVCLMSGGSMMYIDAVCNGIDDIPTINEDIRNAVKNELQEKGLESLCERLKALDPEYYSIVDRNNPRRIVHAIEICVQTGNTYTALRTRKKKERPFNIVKVGLTRDREELYDRINRRTLTMMDEGLLQEAESVYPLRGNNALNTVGYKELFDYFDGNIPIEEAVRRIQSHTREYCRKQQTWFKRDADIRWFHPKEKDALIAYLDSQTRLA